MINLGFLNITSYSNRVFNFKVNTFQLFDTQMTAMIQFKNDNIIIAAGVGIYSYFLLF